MLNQSADYALRAVLFMAQHGEETACTADAIAGALGVPRNYMGKVLNTLARVRLLRSVRGPHGGFRLAEQPDRLTVARVIAPFQRLPERRTCLLGDRQCDPGRPCGAHQRWRQMAEPVAEFFRTTTIAAMLSPLDHDSGGFDTHANGRTTVAALPPATSH
jgi:Rrf2 family protein